MSSSIIDNTSQKAGVTDLAANSSAGSVLFVTAFPAQPYWADALVVIPAVGQGAVTATIRTFDQYGFSYTLSGKPPTSGYTLRWRFVASLASAFDLPDNPTGTWTWADFIDGVIRRVTDNQANDPSLTEAQTEYVRARLAMSRNDTAAYQIHQNRYTAMRRKLLGYQTAMTAQQQADAVRLLISNATASDTLFEQATGYFVKAQIRRDADNDTGAAKAFMDDYLEIRNTRLLGYTYSQNDAALLAAVQNAIYVTTNTNPNIPYLTAQTAAARRDLESQVNWFNAQVAAAYSDLASLYDRVVKEIRAGAIMLQQVVQGYRAGHVTMFDNSNTTVQGFAATAALPPGAQVRDAWIVFPPAAVRVVTPDLISEGQSGGISKGQMADLLTNTADCRRQQCVAVPWEERQRAMVARETNWPLISVQNPQAATFLVAGQLDANQRRLELTWDGQRLDFGLQDLVPFDEGAAQAVANFVQMMLAQEYGDPQPAVQNYERLWLRRQAELYVEFGDRMNPKVAGRSGGWPKRDHKDLWTGSLVDPWTSCNLPPTPALPSDGSSLWLQLLDAVTGQWNTLNWANGMFTAGTWDWRIDPPPALTARVQGGLLQLWDTVGLAWRSIWWVNGALTAGPLDSTVAVAGAATGARIVNVNNVTSLQLADSASPGMWRALYLDNGAATSGPLVPT